MEKKDKKSGRHGRGLDTIGKRILVLTIAILMTFQFCTPTLNGISFAEEITDVTAEELNAVPEETSEAPETVQEEAQPQEEVAETVPEDQTAETGDVVSEETGEKEQGEPVEAPAAKSSAPAVKGGNVAATAGAETNGDGSNDAAEGGNDADGGGLRAGDEPEPYVVQFLDRDGEGLIREYTGLDVGDEVDMPAITEAEVREDYDAAWAIGTFHNDEQGGHWSTTADKVITTEKYTVSLEDIDQETGIIGIIPYYSLKTYTITFYLNENDESPIADIEPRQVNANTGYCLNNIPAVPTKDKYIGKWVYSGGDFTNKSVISSDTKVWVEYQKNVFDVTYMVEGEAYKTDTFYAGDNLALPADPVVEGEEFDAWYLDGKRLVKDGDVVKYYNEDSGTLGDVVKVTTDLEVTAHFGSMNEVRFVVTDDDGNVTERLSQYFREGGETIGTIPQQPFVSGKVFEKWVVATVNPDGTLTPTDVEVTADTEVTESFIAMAKFRKLEVYTITINYYYNYPTDNDTDRKVFETEIISVEEKDFPKVITAPTSTQTDGSLVPTGPIYYPENPTLTVNKEDFQEGEYELTIDSRFVKYTATYDYVYLLKNLDGEGYTEIERTSGVEGVLGSTVTPVAKEYDYATLESADPVVITQASGQELPVKYTRKTYTLSYETGGGTYVAGTSAPYESSVAVSTTTPTRTGYTFTGWYNSVDENGAGVGNPVTGNITLTENKTLYAGWRGNTVNYTIIYMKEKYNPDGNEWVYESSRSATGTVGTTVYAGSNSTPKITAPDGYELSSAMNGTATSGGQGENSSATIAADGSTVLKVYYSLIRYTIVFDANQGTINIGGHTYTGSNYRIENIVLGQDMGDLWPASSNEIYRNNRYFDGWTGGPSTYITKQYELVWNHVKNANSQHVMTYTASWETYSYNRDAYYWLQQPDGTWEIADEYTQIGLNTNNLGPKEIDGYTKHPGTNSDNAGTIPPSSDYPASGDKVTAVSADRNGDYRRDDSRQYESYTTYYEFEGHYYASRYWISSGQRYSLTFKYTYNFYYDRAKYKIDYYYGSNLLTTKPDIFYEADISGAEYNYTPDRPSDVDEDYTWGGWYADSSFAQKYTFGTMPGNNLVLYAKWNAPTFDVTYEWGGATPTKDNETVEKYTKLEKPTDPVKDGYTFDGWYTAAEGGELYDWQNQITEDTTIYAHWTMDPLSYTVHYVYQETGEQAAPDKVVTSISFEVDQVVTENAVTIAGYRPDEGSKDVTLTLGTNEITFYYSQKSETVSYTVRYLLDPAESGGDEIMVAPDKHVNDADGNTLSVIEMAAGVDPETISQYYIEHPELQGEDFYPDEVEKNFIIGSGENVFVFYYSKFRSLKITVNYVDMNGNPIVDEDGNPMAAYTDTFKVGKTFTLNRKPVSGWDLDKAVVGTAYSEDEANASYKITEALAAQGEMVFTVFYKKKVTITANSYSQIYDSENALVLPDDLDGQVTVDGLLAGHSISNIAFDFADNDVTNGRLNAGVATVTPKNAEISGPNPPNPDYYSVRYISGTLEVLPINVTIRVEPDRWTNNVYDGQNRRTGFTNGSKHQFDDLSGTDTSWYVSVSDATYRDTYGDQIWAALMASTVTCEGETTNIDNGAAIVRKDAGDYKYVVNLAESAVSFDPNYSVSLHVRDGRLEIKPKPATLTTGSASKPYDGTPLTNDEAHLYGLVDGESVTLETTGTITEVGETDNTYNITWDNAKASNYTVTEALGKLEVTKANLTVTVGGKTVVYNGSEQSGYSFPASITGTGEDIISKDGEGEDAATIYTVRGLGNGDVLTIEYTPAKGTNVNTYTGEFAETYTIENAAGEDVTEFYNTPTFNAGTLTIEKAPLTITAKKQTYEYNGEAQGPEGTYTSGFDTYVTVEGLQGSDALTSVTLAGKQTNAKLYEDEIVPSAAEIGDATGNYEITYVEGDLEITKLAVKVEIKGNQSELPYDGEEHTVTGYTATADSELYKVSGDTVDFTFSGDATATQKDVGTDYMDLTASQFANTNDNFDVTFTVKEDGYQSITPIDVVVTIKGNTATETYNGREQKVEGYTVTSISSNLYTEDDFTFTGEAIAKGTNVDTYPMNLQSSQFTNTNPNFNNVVFQVTDGSLTIKKANLTITAKDQEYTYNGSAQGPAGTYTAGFDTYVTVEGLADGDALTSITLTGSQTDVDLYEDEIVPSAAAIGNATGNYDITYVKGDLEITKKALTITAKDQTYEYNGEAQGPAGTYTAGFDTYVTVEGLADGDALTSITLTGSQTDVDLYEDEIVPSAAAIGNATGNYDITYVKGDLEITKKALTITAKDQTYEYNGEAQGPAGTYTAGFDTYVTVEGLADGDALTSITLTGSQTDVDLYEDEIVPSAAAIGNATGNYDITYVKGDLEITKKALTITAKDQTYEYNGEAQGPAGTYTAGFDTYVTVEGLADGDALTSITLTGSQTDVDLYEDEIVPSAAAIGNATGNYDITYVKGDLEITKKALTITAKDQTYEYNGEAQGPAGTYTAGFDTYVTVEGLADGDALTSITLTGSQTDVDLYEDEIVPSAAAIGNATGNYDITYVKGDLEITKKALTITAKDQTYEYNGEAQGPAGTYTAGFDTYVTVEGLADGDALTSITLTGSQTDVDLYEDEIVPSAAAIGNATGNYDITYVKGDLEITKKALTITAKDQTYEYNGEAQGPAGTYTAGFDTYVTVEGLADGDALTSITLTGSQTDVDLYEDEIVPSAAAIGNATGNYDITYVKGDLEITKKALTITAKDQTYEYNGEAQGPAGTYTAGFDTYVTVEGLADGDALTSITLTGSQTDVDLYEDEIVPSAAAIGNATGNYDITYVKGDLEITKKALTITAKDQTYEYNGEAQGPAGTYTAGFDTYVTVEGLADGDALTSITLTGSQTDVDLYEDEIVPSAAAIGNATGNYDITYVKGDLEITKNNTAITIESASDSKMYDGTALHKAEYTVTYGGTAVAANEDGTFTLPTGDTLTITDTSNVVHVADTAANNNTFTYVLENAGQYETVTPTYGTLTITTRSVTLTSATDSKEYDGTPLTNDTVTVTGDGFVTGEGATYDVTGTITEVGNTPNTFTYTLNEGTTATDYSITTANGTLTVSKSSKALTIESASDSKMYDGSKLTAPNYTVKYGDTEVAANEDGTFTLPTGDKLTITDTSNVVHVADTAANNNTFTYDLENAGQYETVTPTYGTLTITTRSVTLTSATDSKEYDGTPLTNDTVTVTGDGFIEGEGATYDVTGTITEVGNTPNTFTYTLNEGTTATDYSITTANGTLTVSKSSKALTIESASDSKMYDGSKLTAPNYTVKYGDTEVAANEDGTFTLPTGDKLTITDTSNVVHVADTAANNNTFTYVLENAGQYETVTPTYGTLTITTRSVTLTSATDSKEYDGTPLTNDTVTVTGDGFVTGEGATYDVTGTITEVGNTPNTFTYTLNEGTTATDYSITTANGTLTVSKSSKALTIESASDSKKYDGTALHKAEYTVTYGGTAVAANEDGTFTLPTGDKLTITDTSNVVHVADTAANNNTFTYVLENAGQYETVTPTYGTLTITTRSVTLTSATDSKEYDGTPLTNDTVTVTGDGFVTGEGATYDVTGTITEVGNTPNAFTYTLNEGTTATDYSITTANGTLTVSKSSKALTIESASDSKMYDGTALHKAEYTVTYGGTAVAANEDGTFTLPTGDKLTITDTSNVVHVADTAANNNTFTYVLENAGQYETVTPTYGTLTITTRSVTLTSATDTKPYDGQPLTNHNVAVTGDGFIEGEGATYDVTGTITEVGNTPNAFTYTLNEGTTASDYSIETVPGTLTVSKTDKVLTIESASDSKKYDGTALHKAEYTVTYGGTAVAANEDGTFTLPTGDTLTITDTSNVVHVADTAANNNTFTYVLENAGQYETVTPTYGTLTITTRSVTLTSATDSKEYDGTPLTNDTVTVTGDGFVTGEGATYDVTGTITEVGNTPNTFTYTLNEGTTATDYSITTANGTLTVSKSSKALTIESASDSKKYDGTALHKAEYTVTYGGTAVAANEDGTFTLPTGDKLTITDTSNVVHVADTAANNNTFTYVLENAGQYETVTPTYGTLTITTRSVTLTSATDSKEYDGTPLTNDTVTVTGDGFVTGEGATYDVTGTITEVGNTPNAFTYTLNEGTTATDYSITTANGTLTVSKSSKALTIESASDSKMYDGTALHKAEYTVTYGGTAVAANEDGTFTLPTGDKLTITDTSNVVHVADTAANNNTFTYVLENADQYGTVTPTYGTLTITTRSVIMTSETDSKEYDGEPLTNDTVTVTGDGFIEGEGATYDVTGTITEVGNTPNTFTYTLNEGTTATDYSIETVPGTLTITQNSKAVTIESASDSKKYDGTALHKAEYTVTYGGTAVAANEDGTFTLPTGDTLTITDTSNVVHVADTAANNNTFTYDLENAGQYETVTPTYGTLTITTRSVTMTSATDTKPYDGTPLTNDTVTVTGDGFIEGEGATYDVTGTITEVGNTPNTFTYTLNEGTTASDYNITTVNGTLTVTKSDKALTIESASDSKKYDGTALHKAEYTVTYGGTAVAANEDGTFTLPTGDTLTITDTSNVVHVADTAANNNTFTYELTNAGQYETVTPTYGTLTITARSVIMTSATDSKEYDGQPLTNHNVAVTGDGFIEGEGATYDVTGTITEVGNTPNTFTYTLNEGTTATDYSIQTANGTLTISKSSKALTIESASDSKMYDGSKLTAPTYTVTYGGEAVAANEDGTFTLPTGDTLTITDTSNVVHVADTAANNNTFTYELTNAGQYETVTPTYGTLTITARSVIMTSATDSKEYDGQPLTNHNVAVTGDGFIEGEGATYDVTGTITDVGNTPNSFTYSLNEGTTATDYSIQTANGTLTIERSTAEITVVPAGGSKVYDGTPLTKTEHEDFTVTGVPEGFTWTATADGTVTNVTPGEGEKAVNAVTSFKIFNEAGQDVTDQFSDIDKSATATLTITPATLTVTTGSANKPYDGTPLTKDEASITGFVNNETATVKATGTITEVGTTPNTYEITWGTTKASNYTITENLGTLKIEENKTQIEITAPSDTKTYDGTALTAPGTEDNPITVTGLPEGFTWTVTVTGSQTNAGNSANTVDDGYKFFNAAGEDKTANFPNVKKTDGTLTVEPKAVTITTGSDSKPYDGTPLTKDEASITGLVKGESVTLKATGTITEVGDTPNIYSITWDKALASNYTVSEELGTLTITQNGATVTLTAPSDSKTYDGTALTCDGTGEKKVTASGLPEGFTVEATASGSQTDAGESANVVNDGYVIKNAAGEDKTANFTNVTKVDGTLTVNKKAVTISTGSDSKAYDGSPLTNAEAEAEGIVEGETYNLVATGSQTEVGNSQNTYSMTWAADDNEYTAKASNYTVTDNLGTLTVTASDAEVIITAPSDSKTYDGTALTAPGTEDKPITVTGLPEGFTWTVTVSGSQTDAGESANTVDEGYKFFNADGVDKTANFTNVTTVNGTLTVNPKAVTITTGSDSKAYDGTPLTEGTATIEGLVQGESVTLVATGSQTEVGSSDNTYSITWDKAKASNYTVTDNLGTLTVTTNGAEVVLTAPSDSKTYDGTALTAPGTEDKPVTATGLPEGFTVEATASGSQTDAGESANVVNDGYKILNAAGEDKTANFTNVTKVDGTLTVNKKAVTISTGSDKKEYDGTPLTEGTATITGLVEGETYKLEATGSQTEVGNSQNTYSMTWAAEGNDYTAKEGNYTVTDDLGTLEVTKNTAKVTITAGSDDKTYDGKPLTSDEISATGLPEGFTVTGTTEGSQTDAGKSDNTVTSYKILDPDGNDKTGNFTNVTTEKGTLEVTPKAVTIKTGTSEKEYDGQPLTNSEVTITGLVEGESVTLKTTGTQTEVGSSDNTYSIVWDNADEDNYTVTDELGTLTVKINTSTAITITAPSDSKVYDGHPLTCDGTGEKKVTATGLPEGFTVTGKADGSQTNAGTSDNTVTEYKILNADGEDRTANFTNITLATGTLEVTKRPLTIKSGSAEKPYDGTPLTEDSYELEGTLADTDELTVTCSGSQTLVGSSENPFTWDINPKPVETPITKALKFFGLADDAYADETTKANYDVKEVKGTLTVTDKKVDPDDVLTKTHTDENGESQTYKVGETITFTIEVTNIYDEAKTITLTEIEGVTLEQSVFEDVEPGAVVTTTATYTVTEEDALAGTFKNTVKAEYSGEDEPFTNEDEVKDFAHMTVEKKVTNTPADGKAFRTGETIKYEITVKNDGTAELKDIVVKDELTGDEWTIDSLAAGKTKTFKAEYLVTEKDGAAGSVTNVATAEGTDPDGDKTPGTPGEVKTTTDKAEEPTVPKTGDNTPIVEFSVIFGASIITLLMMLFRRKKERA